MSNWLRPLLGQVLANLSMALTLAGLGGLAWVGHHYEWKVPAFSSFWNKSDEGPRDKPEGPVEPLPTDNGPPSSPTPDLPLRTIQLDSPGAAYRAGFRLAEVSTRTMSQQVRAYGALDYDQTRYAPLSTRASGQAGSVFKGLGDPVRKGDILAVIESPDVGKAKAEFLQAHVQFNVRKINYEQMLTVRDKMSEQVLRNAEAMVREAHIKLLNDQQTLINLGLPVRSDDLLRLSDDQLLARVRLLGLPPELTKGLDTDTLSANLLPLKASIDGQVVARNLVVGENATPATPQFVLADVSRLWVMLDVRSEEAGRLARGQEVLFIPDGARQDRNDMAAQFAAVVGLGSGGSLPAALALLSEPGELAVGQIDWISPEVDEKTRTVRVRAIVPNAQRRFRPHTFGSGWITVQSNPEVLVVPNEAIQRDGPHQFVFVRSQNSDQTFETREVQTGIKDDQGYTEVLKGVYAGEKVVTTGSHTLKTELFKDRLGGDE